MLLVPPTESTQTRHTIWGLEPIELHDRFWAARGVQVVRQGEPSHIVENAELFLLTSPAVLTIFKLRQLLETLNWTKPELLCVRVRDHRDQGYRERAVADEQNRFIRFERIYDGRDTQLARVGLTRDQELARSWQTAGDPVSAWRRVRRLVGREHRAVDRIAGGIYDRDNGEDNIEFMRALISLWRRPDSTISGVRTLSSVRSNVWGWTDTQVDPSTRFIGPIWIGAGRAIDGQTPVVGPAVLWDDQDARPPVDSLRWDEIEPSDVFARPIQPRQRSRVSLVGKRVFDVLFSLGVLAITLPLYPFIMLAISLEDGGPFFFAHRRETLGGRQFPCIKFRSMRKDAEVIKARLAAENSADGPQFFIENDPRLTRVGALLRNLDIDELPQFLNVLLGHMSVVGPRPSPFTENQFCPPWREARLSVRPGITGLWQVRRSRRQGLDFQEWIRYDIQYVESASWRLDLWIIWKTVLLMVRGLVNS